MQTKIIHLMGVGGILLLLFGAYIGVFRPQLQRLAALRAQQHTLHRELNLAGQVHQGLDHMQTEVTAIERQLVAFDQQLPREVQFESFLRQIDQVARQTGLHVTLIKPGTVQPEELYSQFPVSINAEAPFPVFYSFLDALDNLPRFTKIETLSIARKGDTSVCTISLTLLIYMTEVRHES